MSRFLVSIIIPTYNVEQYIESNIRSLLNQTIGFENIEVIYSDDNSNDHTIKIISKYINKYNNIKLIVSEKNSGGPSTPRNKGIDVANGKYIMFMDPDDEYYDNTIELLYNNIEKSNDDLVLGKICLYYSNGVTKNNPLFNTLGSSRDNLKIDENLNFLQLIASIPGMIIKRKLINKNNIYFPTNIKVGEDKVFQARLFLSCNTFGYINENVYKYKIRASNDSLSQKSTENIYSHIEQIDKVIDELKKYINEDEIYFNAIMNDLGAGTIYRLNESFLTLNSELKKYIFNKSKNIVKYMDLDRYYETVVSNLNEKLYLDIFLKCMVIKYGNIEALEGYFEKGNKINSLSNEIKLLKNKSAKKNKIKMATYFKYKIKERLFKILAGCIYYLTIPFFYGKNITLIAERTDQAEDNSYHLFKYCREKYSNDLVYYIINKKSKQYNNIKDFGNVIQHNSIKHYLYLIHAKNYVSAYDFLNYAYPKRKNVFIKYFEKYIRANRIFLQHGVSQNRVKYFHKYNNKYDYIVCATSKECNMFREIYGYSDDELIKSGFARFDNLIDTSKINDKKILFMPTWRDDLKNCSDNEFKESSYYKAVNSLLKNSELLDILSKNNIKLIFYPHYMMQKFLHLFNFNNPNIIVASKKKYNVQELLKECNLLISDFSSVGCDFAYLNKLVVFYQFSKENYHYEINRESRFNSQKDFGIIVDKEEEVISNIKKFIHNEYKNYFELDEELFLYRDNNNCERIYNFIKNIPRKKNKVYADLINDNNNRKLQSTYYPNSYRLKTRKSYIDNILVKEEIMDYGSLKEVIYYDKLGIVTHKDIYVMNKFYKTKSYSDNDKKGNKRVIVKDGVVSEIITYFDNNKKNINIHQYFIDNKLMKRIIYFNNGEISTILKNDFNQNPEILKCYDKKGKLIKDVYYYKARKPKEVIYYDERNNIIKKEKLDINSHIIEVEKYKLNRPISREVLLPNKEILEVIKY